jgi:hypothetical protein
MYAFTFTSTFMFTTHAVTCQIASLVTSTSRFVLRFRNTKGL